MDYRATYHDGGVLRIRSNRLPSIDDGAAVIVTIEQGRSATSHKHQFAWIKDAWENLPESLQDMPWAETAETMRKHALIACGYHQSYMLDCGAKATALRIKAALVSAEYAAHGYALGRVTGTTLQVWTPESQSVRAMGGKRFQESKTAILDWIADKIGVTPEQLRRNAA